MPTPEQPFPETLGPFGLAPTELLPEMNFEESSYQLRSGRHKSEQLELLKSFGVVVKGRMSPLSQLTLPVSARRTAMIPEHATHFVWAYQGIDLEKLTAEQNSQLNRSISGKNVQTDSAELSFLSLGGYVYLQYFEATDTYRVLRANAIAIETDKTCRFGTIDRHVCGQDKCNPEVWHTCTDGKTRCDTAVTADVASPELLDGAGIGLETDIYALGMVMWEVFTRRKAWHWIHSPCKVLAIVAQVSQRRRPKMPESLSPDCARQIRSCLHQDPAQRPTAKAITQWINECRSELAEAMKVDEVVRGRHEEEGGKWRRMKMNARAIHDRADEHWSLRGLYSLHPSRLKAGGEGFTLTGGSTILNHRNHPVLLSHCWNIID